MEPAGLAVGIAGLAALLTSCIDGYQLIQRGLSVNRDYKILQTKFDNQELRLFAWGTACGLLGAVGHDDYLNQPQVTQRISATLQCIHGLFDDQTELRQRYGLRMPKPAETTLQTSSGSSAGSEGTGPLSLTSSGTSSIFSSGDDAAALSMSASSKLSLGTFFRRKKRQRLFNDIGTAALWAIEDYEKFSQLVQHLKDFNDDLESLTRLTNITRRQRVIVEYEVEEVDDLDTLESIELAGHGQNAADIVSDTASSRLASIRGGSVRSMSIVSSSDLTRRTGSFESARSYLSLQERASIEFGRDDLLSVLASNIVDINEMPALLPEGPANGPVGVSAASQQGLYVVNPDVHPDIIEASTLEANASELTSNTHSVLPSQTPTSPKNPTKQPSAPVPTFKVLAIGHEECRTTDLLTVLTLGYWPEVYIPTVFKDYVMDCKLGSTAFKLLLVDTAGEQKYPLIRRLSLPRTHIILVCFRADKSVKDAVDSLNSTWLPEIRMACPKVPLLLVGIQDPESEVTLQNGPSYEEALRVRTAREIGALSYHWCNPKTGEGVEAVFESASRVLIRKYPAQFQAQRPRKRSRISSLLRGLGAINEDGEAGSI